MKYNPEGSAADIYESLAPIRDNFLSRAEECAALTIPMLIPPNSGQRIGNILEFPTPRQGIGARGVNHLSSRLLLTLLPPSAPFFKYLIDPFALDILTQANEQVQAEVKATLSQIEQSAHQVVESEAMRVSTAEICKHLLVSGNALMYLPEKGGLSFYPLYQYVCMRDPEGDHLIELVLHESVDEGSLPKDVKEFYDACCEAAEGSDSPYSNTDDGISLYTRVYLDEEDGLYHTQQEFSCGEIIPGTMSTVTKEKLNYLPLRWTKVPGEAYGRGLVEEYKGDLESLEILSQALIDGAVASARLVGLVRPNSNTRPKDLNDAQNGEFVYGVEDDVKFLQVEKSADFRTAAEIAARIEKRLEGAFLLNSSVTRDAERVTAEEIRYVAQELETALGGVYTILAHEFQLPLIKAILARLEKKGAIPKFPKQLRKSVKPVIVTGIDALGRNAELERFRAAMSVLQGMLPPEVLAQSLQVSPVISFVFSQAGVTIKGLVKTQEQLKAEQMQQQNAEALQTMIKQGTGPVINANAQQAALAVQGRQGS